METKDPKHRYGRFHTPSRHNMTVRLDHMVHDERFWPIVIALLLIIAFVALALWVGLGGQTNEEMFPTYPFYP